MPFPKVKTGKDEPVLPATRHVSPECYVVPVKLERPVNMLEEMSNR